jgi:hypothetical protein
MAKFHVEMLGNSEVLKSRSIEISQNLLLQKRTRTPNQELLHDKKSSSPSDFRSRTRWFNDLGCL